MVLRTAVPIPPVVTDKDLPETDGKPVESFAQPPQAMLLTSAIRPVLDRLHRDGTYLIGADSGIYWERTDPPLDGCKAPDWFYVPGVPQGRPEDGDYRRSYVLWNERVPPYLVIEFVSGDGAEERDATPGTGKFWVYEQGIRAECYAIFDPLRDGGHLEVFERVRGRYRRMRPNDHGHFELSEIGVALGVWRGVYQNQDLAWLRFFDRRGAPLPTVEDRVELERVRAEQERQRAEAERRRAEQEQSRAAAAEGELAALKDRLRAKGIDPDSL